MMEIYKPTLWDWFGLSYASWLTIPRVLLHQMPDEWQDKMVDLLIEYQQKFPCYQVDLPQPVVQARKDGRFISWPEYLLNYRHPDLDSIKKLEE